MPVYNPAMTAASDIDIGDVNILDKADAQINPAVQGGVGVPKAVLASGAGAHVEVAIPAGVKFVDFLVDVASYVVANAITGDPFATNNGIPYQPNLNFRLPCTGCTFLHLKAGGAANLSWNTIS